MPDAGPGSQLGAIHLVPVASSRVEVEQRTGGGCGVRLRFDLAGLPGAAEVLYASLELARLDGHGMADWRSCTLRLGDAALEVGAWALRRARPSAAGWNAVAFGAQARQHIRGLLGRSALEVHLTLPTVDGRPAFAAEAGDEFGPRLRLAYLPLRTDVPGRRRGTTAARRSDGPG
jgi:hypothetical protein